MRRLRFWFGLIGVFYPLFCSANGVWSGDVAVQGRWFAESNPNNDLNNNLALSAEPEWYYPFPDSRDSLVFTGFLRLDENDDERTHADIRELYWQKVAEDWELILGINKIFWGVTETVHLVDIINQTDAVENIDGEDKLGQLMTQFSLIQNWGVLDIFVLPGFRERTFPGPDGRPQLTPLVVDTDNPIYESSAEDEHIDYALRWSQIFGIWDFGLAHFSGTSRAPRFIPGVNADQQAVLRPLYELIDQTSVDLQATLEAWLLKLEAIRRSGQGPSFTAAATGFEYTFVGVMESNTDIGIVTEYLYDERDLELFDDDLALAARITLNDVQSTEILAGIITDLNNDSQAYFIEASRRIGDSYTLDFELRGATNVAADDPSVLLKQERFLQIEFSYFF